jgi:hypothetical protein
MQAADEGQPCPTCDELLDLLPHRRAVSHTVEIVQALEARGIIKVDRFQRARRVTIVSSGRATAQPGSTAPHWRTRPASIPSITPATVQQRKPDTATAMFNEARRLGKSPQDFLCDLTWIGWEMHLQTKCDSAGPVPPLGVAA